MTYDEKGSIIAETGLNLILQDLHSSSLKCAPNLALDLGLSKNVVYPLLSDLLAREWVSILPDPTGVLNESPMYRQFIDNLQNTIEDHESLSEIENQDEQLERRTRIWYDFFNDLNRLELRDSHTIYYIALTPQGSQALQQTSLV